MLERILNWIEGWLLRQAPVVVGAPPRSPKWRSVRAKFLESHSECAACGTKEGLEVHHVEPYHEHPSKELDLDNLITVCRDCHFMFGHLRDWTSWNADVRQDAAAFRLKRENRP